MSLPSVSSTPFRLTLAAPFLFFLLLSACQTDKTPEQSTQATNHVTATETPSPLSPPPPPPEPLEQKSSPAPIAPTEPVPDTTPTPSSLEPLVLSNDASAPGSDVAAVKSGSAKGPDTTRPAVSIKFPLYGAIFNRNLVTVTGTVDDASAMVTVNDMPAVMAGRSFIVHVPLTEQGSNPLVAIAVDRAGNRSKDSIMVTLDTIAPDISISRPADGLVTPVGRVTVEGRISDADEAIEARINGNPLVLDRGEFSVTVPLDEGTNVMIVSASDAVGNYRSVSTSVYLDTPMPFPVVVAPEELDEVYDEEEVETVVPDGGALTGKVTFKGVPPAPKTVALDKFPNVVFCARAESDGHGNRVVQEVRVGKDQALGDVVVAIQNVRSERPFEFKGTKVTADGCRFLVQGGPSRFAGVVVERKEIAIENMDADPNDPKAATGVLHNPHAYEVSGASNATIFNLPLPEKGQIVRKPVVLRKRDGVFKVECDQHSFMQVFFLPVENPYYAIVKNDGTFRIRDIPPGAYIVVAWHPILGKQEAIVTIEAKREATADFSFTAK